MRPRGNERMTEGGCEGMPVNTCFEFDELRARGLAAVEDGRFDEADVHYRQALTWAREHGDERLVDLAICNLAAVAIQRGSGEGEVALLREILLRSGDPANCRLAAYHISVQYQYAKNFKKSAFYARIAVDRARLLDRQDWLASSYNQLGNALLCESFVSEARQEYRRALDLISPEPSTWRGWILDNLGYCHILQGTFREGYALLYESLRVVRRMKAERPQAVILLDIAFADLETGRFRQALRHALQGLELAERTRQSDNVKNALYLLGEAAHLSGDDESARGYFHRLQRDFYPDVAFLPGFLLAVDVRKLINLHA